MKSLILDGDAVRAILEGRKSQMRRIMKFPINSQVVFAPAPRGSFPFIRNKLFVGPYGVAGDQFWIRETFFKDGDRIIYKADNEDAPFKWTSATHMPIEHSRIAIRIKDVYAEQALNISEEDAIEDGVIPEASESYRDAFRRKWVEKHKLPGWVWVARFERV